MTKPTCEQLIEQLGDKQDITICSDVVYGLGFEYSQLKKEIDRLNNIMNNVIKFIEEEGGYNNDYSKEATIIKMLKEKNND